MIDEYCNHGYPATNHCYPTATVDGLNYSHQSKFTNSSPGQRSMHLYDRTSRLSWTIPHWRFSYILSTTETSNGLSASPKKPSRVIPQSHGWHSQFCLNRSRLFQCYSPAFHKKNCDPVIVLLQYKKYIKFCLCDLVPGCATHRLTLRILSKLGRVPRAIPLTSIQCFNWNIMF